MECPSDPWKMFAAWSGVARNKPQRPLSDSSVLAYRSIWSVYLDHLGDLPWFAAAATDVHAFLSTLASSRRGRTSASSVTQSRYASVLEQIYAAAVAKGWIASNPVTREALVSKSEQHESLVFNSADWRELVLALRRQARAWPGLADEARLSPQVRWQEVRDHALLSAMVHAALSVGELRAMVLSDVAHPRLRWVGATARPMVSLPLLPDGANAKTPMSLALRGARPSQTRTLTATAPLQVSMLNWLALRATRPRASQEDPVFASQKGGGATAVSAKAIFELANQFILDTLGSRYPEGLAHAGPTTLRNSCIVRWLDEGMPEDEVLKQAGFQDAQALRRLRQHQIQHAHPRADLTQLTTPAAGDDDERHDPPR